MADYLKKVNAPLSTLIRKVGRAADRCQMKVYLVGGTVRDILLKRVNKDLDFVVEGDAPAFAHLLEKTLKTKPVVYPVFRTATFILPKGVRLDFVSARSETYARGGALPSVKEGTLKDDLFRRDFTVNAMAIGVNQDQFGQLIDLYGGLKDLRQKQIRILHAKSFKDDPTRILRAIRFGARFKFRLEEKTGRLLRKALKAGLERTVKPPRYFSEFKKILTEDDPVPALTRLNRLDAFKFLGCAPRLRRPAFTVLRKNIGEADAHQHWLIYFLTILEGVGLKERADLVMNFQLTRETRKCLAQSADLKQTINFLSTKKRLCSDVYWALNDLSIIVVLYMRLRSTNKYLRQRIKWYLDKGRDVTLKINGQDIQQLGLGRGKNVGAVLRKVFEAKLNGQVKNKSDELRLAKSLSVQ